jgi:tetratricopeptide (TPR) repeat protein
VKRHSIFFIVLAALVFLASGTAPIGAQMSGQEEAARSQADAFLAPAALALDSGSPIQARPLVDSALELAPDYSEGLFLRARLELADRSATLSAIADLRAALRQGTWKSTDPAAAQQALGEVLLRAGRPSEARPLLERLITAHPEDPRNTLLLARTFAKSADAAGEQKVLSDAAVSFPLVDDFRLLSAVLFDRQGRGSAARDVIAVGLKVHPESLPLMLASARLERAPKARLAAVDLYLEKGGSDPLGPVLALESSPKDRRKYLDLFLSLGGLAHQDLVDRVAAVVRGRKDLAGVLQDALDSYSGTRDLDADQDGFWEDRWTFDKGGVTDWVREPAQDGVTQYSARFVKDSPASFSYTPGGDVKVTLNFSRYPFIESASETTAQVPPRTARAAQNAPSTVHAGGTLFLVPYTMQCAFLQPGSAVAPGLAPRIAVRFKVPTLEQLQKGAYRREEYSPDGATLLRRSELSRGQKVYVEEDADGDGRLDHRVWFLNGQPARGERSPTGDGVFPIKETWRGGKLVRETVISGFPEMDSSRGQGGDDTSGQGGTFVRELAAAPDRKGAEHIEALK